MSFRWRPGLRARLVLLLVTAFAAMAVLMAWHLQIESERHVQAARDRLLDDARLMAARQGLLVARAEAILNALLLSREMQPGVPRADCDAFLVSYLQQAREFVQMTRTGAIGEPDCAALRSAAPSSVADRSYFKLAMASRDMTIGDVVVGRTSGRRIIVFGKAMRGPDGRAIGAVFVTLEVSWLEHELAKAALPTGARVAVVDGSGTVAARFPDPDGQTGSSGLQSPIVRKVLEAVGDGTLDDVNLAGERRLVAHVPLLTSAAGSRYHLLLSLPRQDIEAPARREALVGLAALLAVLGATLAVVLVGGDRLLLRPLQRLSDAALRLRSGDYSARTGLPHTDDEIGRLAQTLDESTAAIQHRESLLALANDNANARLAERSEMLDVLAHEVRQPLNNASAALQAASALLAAQGEPSVSAPLLRVETVLGEVQASIDNRLAVASLLVGDDRVHRDDTDVDALIGVAIADLPSGQRWRVKVERATPTRTASMDANLMRLALRNLLSNAVGFSPGGSPVVVRVSDSDHPLALVIDVIDQGGGIATHKVPQLFDRTGPGGGDPTRRRGLGLYIVGRVMALHGGSVVLERNGPHGVTMRLVIAQAVAD